MLYFLLTVFFTTAIALIFKLFDRFKIDNLQAIVINYATCVICATLVLGEFPIPNQFWEKDWFSFSIFLGIAFIIGFYVIAATVQKFSVTLATVMQKMSLIGVAIFAILFYQESLTWFKGMGVATALAAIWLVNRPGQSASLDYTSIPKKDWIFPILTFGVAVAIDSTLFHVEQQTPVNADLNFIAFIFGIAGISGGVWLIIRRSSSSDSWSIHTLWGGVLLGVANFFGLYFLLKTIGSGWEGSVVFPVVNVSVISLAAVFAWILFHERLSKTNIAGLLLALLTIGLLARG